MDIERARRLAAEGDIEAIREYHRMILRSEDSSDSLIAMLLELIDPEDMNRDIIAIIAEYIDEDEPHGQPLTDALEDVDLDVVKEVSEITPLYSLLGDRKLVEWLESLSDVDVDEGLAGRIAERIVASGVWPDLRDAIGNLGFPMLHAINEAHPIAEFVEEEQTRLALELSTEIGEQAVVEEHPYAYGDGVNMVAGNQEWVVFANYDDAMAAAIANCLQTMEEVGWMDFLEQFLTIDDVTAREIALEDADSYVGDLDDDRAIEEADLQDEYGDLESALESAVEAENEEEEERLRREMELLVDRAKDTVRESMETATEERITSDPVGWLEEMGYLQRDRNRDRYGHHADPEIPAFVTIDYDAAAEYAVNTDGVAHFLASYDSNETDLPSGGLAYRVG